MLTPDKNFRIRSNDSSYKSSDEVSNRERPDGAPKSNKDFSKIIDKGDKDEHDQSTLSDEEEEGGLLGSIFELSKKKILEKKEPDVNLYAMASSQAEKAAILENETEKGAVEDALAKKNKSSTSHEFTEEQPDIAGVTSFTAAMKAASASASMTEAVKPNKNVQDIINQIVDNMNVSKAGDITNTTFRLKNIPMFENVDVTLTAYKMAPREFNLTISNLTQLAKNMLDMNLNPLLQGLEQKNIVLHMVTTTTVEIPNTAQTAESENQKRDQQDQQQQGKGGQSQRDEEQ
jgi:hypothetical protein